MYHVRTAPTGSRVLGSPTHKLTCRGGRGDIELRKRYMPPRSGAAFGSAARRYQICSSPFSRPLARTPNPGASPHVAIRICVPRCASLCSSREPKQLLLHLTKRSHGCQRVHIVPPLHDLSALDGNDRDEPVVV